MRLTVRPAGPADAASLARMIRALARYEGKQELDHITQEAVEDWFFGSERVCNAFLAERADETLGYLAWYPIFSPFKGGRVLLVENLWVEEGARGSGAGRALLQALARDARARGILRLELNVRADNDRSRGFYRRLGFIYPGEEVCRIEDDALAALAQEGERSREETFAAHSSTAAG